MNIGTRVKPSPLCRGCIMAKLNLSINGLKLVQVKHPSEVFRKNHHLVTVLYGDKLIHNGDVCHGLMFRVVGGLIPAEQLDKQEFHKSVSLSLMSNQKYKYVKSVSVTSNGKVLGYFNQTMKDDVISFKTSDELKKEYNKCHL